MPPLAIAAGIAAVGTIGGALISSHSANKAANQANQSQQEATHAQLQLGRESLGLNRDIYNSNYNMLSPFVSRGNVAGDSINALLGLPSAPAMTSPLATASGGAGGTGGGGVGSGGYGGPSLQQIMGMNRNGGQAAINNYMSYYQQHPDQDPGFTNISMFHGDPFADESAANSVLAARNSYLASHPAGTATTPAPGTTPASGTAPAPAPSPMGAFNTFANSAGMQFQQQQAANGLNNFYAGHSQLQSGAAMKAVPEYLQKQALNNYFMPYMSLLGGQQGVGAQAGSAVAGVGANFGNTAAGINSQMGAAIGNGADAASNAALLRGQNNSQMWNSIGGALGSLGSSFFRPGG